MSCKGWKQGGSREEWLAEELQIIGEVFIASVNYLMRRHNYSESVHTATSRALLQIVTTLGGLDADTLMWNIGNNKCFNNKTCPLQAGCCTRKEHQGFALWSYYSDRSWFLAVIQIKDKEDAEKNSSCCLDGSMLSLHAAQWPSL